MARRRAFLQRYLEIENGRVPAEVLGRRELLLAHADRRLHIRIAQTGGLNVLLLDERDTRIDKHVYRKLGVPNRTAAAAFLDGY
jgi:hypothetical protein